jgi:hypothetical protein
MLIADRNGESALKHLRNADVILIEFADKCDCPIFGRIQAMKMVKCAVVAGVLVLGVEGCRATTRSQSGDTSTASAADDAGIYPGISEKGADACRKKEGFDRARGQIAAEGGGRYHCTVYQGRAGACSAGLFEVYEILANGTLRPLDPDIDNKPKPVCLEPESGGE